MSRTPRKKSSTGIYHVMLRGADRRIIFSDDEDCNRFLETMKRAKKESGFRLYAWCLMGNHVHLLLKEEKEPMEIVFLFWSLAVGIVIGAGMIPLAVIGSLIIGIILVIFANRKIRNTPYILIVNCNDENAEKSALELIGKSVGKYMVKSKSVNASGIELTTEVRIKNNSTDFVNRVNELTGVSAATLVSYNGEYMA